MQKNPGYNWDRLTVEVLLLIKSSPLALGQVEIVASLKNNGFQVGDASVTRALQGLVRAHEISETSNDGVVRYQSVLHANMERNFNVFD